MFLTTGILSGYVDSPKEHAPLHRFLPKYSDPRSLARARQTFQGPLFLVSGDGFS